jgi:hypothetical protein
LVLIESIASVTLRKESVMTMSVRVSCAATIFLGFLATMPARAADAPAVEAKAAFEKLKSLAGEWQSKSDGHGHDASGKILYKVTSNGSVVMETYFPGSDHEMISMYHLDGDELRMTHYCAANNQPRMHLDKKASKPNDLKFVFDGGTNLDPSKDMHIHGGRIIFIDKARVETEWDGYMGGKSMGATKFVLTRP